MRNIIFVFFAFIFFTGCSTKKEILYFQDIEKVQNLKVPNDFEPVFEVNDILHIKVSSFNEEVAMPFQMSAGGQTGQGGGGMQQNSALMGYLVDVDGKIQFPVLGKVAVAGKTRSELETYLTDEIRKYVTDAVIAVRLLNFRVVVLGEAGSQNVVQVSNEKISITELLASVGGISYNGKRDNILVIREIEGVKSFGYVDLTSSDVFKNPYYYLRQNDIVYVEPTYRTVKSAGFITDYSTFISLFTTALSLYFIFTR